MRVKSTWLGLTLALILAGAPRVAVLSPWKRIGLQGLIREPNEAIGYTPHAIFALAFSPDGARIAVLAGMHYHDPQKGFHLLVLDLAQGAAPLQVEFPRGVPMPTGHYERIRWSNDGHILFVQFPDRALLLDGGTAVPICESHDVRHGYLMPGGLIGSNLFVVGDTGAFSEYIGGQFVPKKNGRLWLYSLACEPASESSADASPISGDTAPEAGLLLMADSADRITVLHEPDGRQVYSIPDGRPQMHVAFLESGGAVCGGTLPRPEDGSLRCWTLGTAGPGLLSTYEAKKGGTAPFATSSEGSVVLLPERGFSYSPLTENKKMPLKRYALWDAQSGRTIATIAPRKQWWPGFSERIPRRLGDSLVMAVSPDGTLAAVAAEDAVEIFKVPSPLRQ